MTTAVIVVADFRVLYPQFANSTAFPDVKIETQFTMATAYISPNSACSMSDAVRLQALYLMTAHLLALGVLVAANNYQGQPGVTTGAAVGDVNVTLAPPPVRSGWRYWLNLTPYGTELAALLEALSVGGFYVGGLPERAAIRKVGGVF